MYKPNMQNNQFILVNYAKTNLNLNTDQHFGHTRSTSINNLAHVRVFMHIFFENA